MNRTKTRRATRRKVIPLHFQKSQTSLSQILATSSYKRRIKELQKNNKALAIALQDARCEIALSNKLLQECSNGNTKIMLAKKKLKDMAASIQTLVAGLDEVVSYLDLKPLNLYNEASVDLVRMRIKEPEMHRIEESASNSENSDSSMRYSILTRNSLDQESAEQNPLSQEVHSTNNDSVTEIYDCQVSIQRTDELKDAANAEQGTDERVRNSVPHVPAAPAESPSTPQLDISHSAENMQQIELDLQSKGEENIQKIKNRSPCFKKIDKTVSKIPLPKFDKQNPSPPQSSERKQSANLINRKTFVISGELNNSKSHFINSDNTPATDNIDLNVPKFNDRRGTYVLSAAPESVAIKDFQKSPENVISTSSPPRRELLNQTVILYEDMELTGVLPILNLPTVENKSLPPKNNPTKSASSPKVNKSPIKSLHGHKIQKSKSPPKLSKNLTVRSDFIDKLFSKEEISAASKTKLSRKNFTIFNSELKRSTNKNVSVICKETEQNSIPEVTEMLFKKDLAVIDSKKFTSPTSSKAKQVEIAVSSQNQCQSPDDTIRRSPRNMTMKNQDNKKFFESNSNCKLEDLEYSNQPNLKLPGRKSLKPGKTKQFEITASSQNLCQSPDDTIIHSPRNMAMKNRDHKKFIESNLDSSLEGLKYFNQPNLKLPGRKSLKPSKTKQIDTTAFSHNQCISPDITIRLSPRKISTVNQDYNKFLESNSDCNLDNSEYSNQCNLKISGRKSLKPNRVSPYALTKKPCDPSNTKKKFTKQFEIDKLNGKKDILNFSSSFGSENDSPHELNSRISPRRKSSPQLLKNHSRIEIAETPEKVIGKYPNGNGEKVLTKVSKKIVAGLETPPANTKATNKKSSTVLISKKCEDSILNIPDSFPKQINSTDQSNLLPNGGIHPTSRKSCMKIPSSPSKDRFEEDTISRSSISRKSVRFNLNECILAFQNIKTRTEKSKSNNLDKATKTELELAFSEKLFCEGNDHANRKKRLSHVRNSLKISKASNSKHKLSNITKKTSKNGSGSTESDEEKLKDLSKSIQENELSVKKGLSNKADFSPDKDKLNSENVNSSNSLTQKSQDDSNKRPFSGVSERRSKKRGTNDSFDFLKDIEGAINHETIPKHSASLEQPAPETTSTNSEQTEEHNLQDITSKPRETNSNQYSDKGELTESQKKSKKGKNSKGKKAKPTSGKKKTTANRRNILSGNEDEVLNEGALIIQKENHNNAENENHDKNVNIDNLTQEYSVPLKSLQLHPFGKDSTNKGSVRGHSKEKHEPKKGKNLSTVSVFTTNLKDPISLEKLTQMDKEERIINIKNMQPHVLLESIPILNHHCIEHMGSPVTDPSDPVNSEGRPRRARPVVNLKEPTLNRKMRR